MPRKSRLLRSNRAACLSVQNWGGVSGDAYPLPGVEQPGVNEALAPHVTFASLDSFGSKNSGRDGSVSEYTHAHRFGRDLLLLRISCFHACQKLCFGLHSAVIVNQHNVIVQEHVQRPSVAELICLIPSLLQSNNFRLRSGIIVVLCQNEQSHGAHQAHQQTGEFHHPPPFYAGSIWQALPSLAASEPLG